MVAYLDSSVVLRHILLGELGIRTAFAEEQVIASELLEIESRRVLHRYRMNGDLNDAGLVEAVGRLESVLAGVTLLALTDAVKKRSMGAFPVSVRTLDALHLATALLFVEEQLKERTHNDVIVVSHDDAMNRCARALGFPTPLTTSSSSTTARTERRPPAGS